MKRLLSVLLLAAFCLPVAAADSVVVFNEIMYRPPGEEQRLEWVELRNQMAVDVDLSHWRITGGIQFEFQEGVVIKGGGYAVIAAVPAALASLTGLTNALGPFSGRLSNSGALLELRNNNDRIMDRVEFGVDDDWPSGPNGSGASLCKRDENSASSAAENWTTSPGLGGTPGVRNFPANSFEVLTSQPVALPNVWRYAASADAAWTGIDYNDSGWAQGPGPFGMVDASATAGDMEPVPSVFSSGLSESGAILAPGSRDPHYLLTQSAQPVSPGLPAGATVIQNHPAWLANDAGSSWLGVLNPGTENVAAGSYTYRTTFTLDGFDASTAVLTLRVAADNRLNAVLLNGISKNLSYVGFDSFSTELKITNGFSAGLNTLDFVTANDSTSPNPAGFRVQLRGVARRQVAPRTPLPADKGPLYFRTSFVFKGAPQSSLLELRALLVDGAIFYLNGSEVLRINMPPGPVDAATRAVTNVTRVGLSEPWTIPASHLIVGTNILAAQVHAGPQLRTNRLFGAELSLTTTNSLIPTLLSLAFNETSSATHPAFWVEVMNTGSAPVHLQGCTLSHQTTAATADYPFPAQTLSPGEFLRIDGTLLGFPVGVGDRLFLYGPGRETLLDAIVLGTTPQARWPDGRGRWWSPATLTPGAANDVRFNRDVVINEIMYHPPERTGQPPPDSVTWVELYNRGAEDADLSGWRLSRGVKYPFAAGTVIPARGYLVVADDVAAMSAAYPGLPVVGPFSGSLGRSGDHVQLVDAAGNLASEARYVDHKPWPDFADGGGASLELRDPFADALRPEAWAASIESGRSSWSNYTYRAVANATLGPTNWKEFVLGLLDAGECLIDDLRVTESPGTTPVSLLQNGDFETGLTAWRALGNHSHSRVELDPDDPSNHVLHLVATGPTEHMHNHLETTLAGGRSVTNGREYEIAFRARWLAGNPRLNTRLYFNRVARTTALLVPDHHGTPGTKNSTFVTNAGPTFTALAHSPVLPKPGERIQVGVSVSDLDGVDAVTLYWSADRATWNPVTMTSTGVAADLGYTNYVALVPPQASGALLQFYVQARDRLGAAASYPAAGANSRALIEIADGSAARPNLHRVRVLMLPAEAQFLHAATNVMSNDRLGATVVYDESDVFYDTGLHLQSSERGRNDSSRVGFSIRFNADHLFRGVQKTITLDRSGGYGGAGGKHGELLLWHAVNHAGRLPGIYCDLVQCWAPRSQEDGTAMLRMSAFDGDYFAAQEPNGGDGNLFKLELIYYPTTTVNGSPQAPKRPQPDDVINVDIQNRGDDKEYYRWIFLQQNHAERDDYSQVIALNKAFSVTGATFESEVAARIDADQWMRALAFKAFTGDVDTFTYGLNHNWMIYFRPSDGKALGLLWDMDFSFAQPVNYAAPGTGSANTHRFVRLPNQYRRFYSHLLDLSATTINAAYLGPWATHYSGLLGEDWSSAVNYLQQRSDYLRRGMPLNTPFAITSNGGQDFSVSNGQATLMGTAPLPVDTLTVNGVQAAVTWTTLTNWTIVVPLTAQTNGLIVQGIDGSTRPLTNAIDSITVINTAALPARPVIINEWMADNAGPGGFVDPAGGSFADWFELYNPNSGAVDLSGFFLTDNLSQPDQWKIPVNSVLDGRGFRLVWADGRPELNGVGRDLHTNFQLSKSGDTIALFSPDGRLQHSVTFGPQKTNTSEGFFPDGQTNQVVSMPHFTPASSNQVRVPTAPAITNVTVSPDGRIQFEVRTQPGGTYQVEVSDSLGATWKALGNPWSAEGVSRPVSDLVPGSQRFYRIVLLPGLLVTEQAQP